MAGSRAADVATHTVFTPVLSYRTIPVILVLTDPQHPAQDLGTLELAVTLTPKDSPIEERRDSTVHMLLIISVPTLRKSVLLSKITAVFTGWILRLQLKKI